MTYFVFIPVEIYFVYWWQCMMTSPNGNIFRVTGHLCGELTGPGWNPLTKSSDAELWCCFLSAPEWTIEETIVRLMIWDAIVPIMTSLKWGVWNVVFCEHFRVCPPNTSISCRFGKTVRSIHTISASHKVWAIDVRPPLWQRQGCLHLLINWCLSLIRAHQATLVIIINCLFLESGEEVNPCLTFITGEITSLVTKTALFTTMNILFYICIFKYLTFVFKLAVSKFPLPL